MDMVFGYLLPVSYFQPDSLVRSNKYVLDLFCLNEHLCFRSDRDIAHHNILARLMSKNCYCISRDDSSF